MLLQVFKALIASVSSVSVRMWQLFHLDVSPVATACCNCLGAMHVRGDGAMLGNGCGKAEGDGRRVTSSPACGMQLRQAESEVKK
jgi:hypothetical protein